MSGSSGRAATRPPGCPLEDILECRAGVRRSRFDHSDGVGYRQPGRPCAICGMAAADLEWFWFESPEATWRMLCGRAGWVSFCPRDEHPVQFFLEVLN